MEMATKYWKEEDGLETFYDEDGFCTYVYGGDEFFIAYFYAEKDNGRSYKFYNKVKDLARSLGCKYMTNYIEMNDLNKENYTKKLLIQLKHGSKVIAIENNRVIVLKELY